jgi:hypothetical protein
MDWNWKPSEVRVKKITSSIAQRELHAGRSGSWTGRGGQPRG